MKAVSAISCIEMTRIVQHGRIDLDMPFGQWFNKIENCTGFQNLPVTAPIGIQAVDLPEHHKDSQGELSSQQRFYYEAYLTSFDKVFSACRGTDRASGLVKFKTCLKMHYIRHCFGRKLGVL